MSFRLNNTAANMYTLSPVNLSPDSVDPASLHLFPDILPTCPTSGPSDSCRKVVMGGSRKKACPESVSLYAPTQPRRYVTPSATSKKEIPALFAKNLPRLEPSEDDELDELVEEPPTSKTTEKEQIEWKRRQNTLAARRSRKRKMLHQQMLEDRVEQLTREKDVWKARTFSLQHILRSHGIFCPDFGD